MNLQDAMREAFLRALLANPLRCPKEFQKHVKRVLRKRLGSRGHGRATDNLRKALESYIQNKGVESLQTVLADYEP